MTYLQLAKTSFFLWKPFAWLLGWIMTGVYWFADLLTNHQTVALTIILTTFVVRALMTPLTLKQQRSTRKQQRLQPQVQAIQKKYANKQDPESQQQMQREIQEFYSANNFSPAAGCLPLLVQMPILFGLYEVLRNIPFYVTQVGQVFNELAGTVMGVKGYEGVINSDAFSAVIKAVQVTNKKITFDATTLESVKDFLYRLGNQWEAFLNTDVMAPLKSSEAFQTLFATQDSINSVGWGVLRFNLMEAPGWKGWGIVIPLLAGGLTLLQTLLSQYTTKKRQKAINPNAPEDESQKSTKLLMYLSPVMIFVFAINLPVGLALYWIASSVFGILSQLICDKIIDREEYKEVLRKKEEYAERALIARTAKVENDNRLAARVNKSSMAGDKYAAIRQQQREQAEQKAREKQQQADELAKNVQEQVDKENAAWAEEE